MWKEIGKTVREAMRSWAATARMSVLVVVLTVAGIALIVSTTL